MFFRWVAQPQTSYKCGYYPLISNLWLMGERPTNTTANWLVVSNIWIIFHFTHGMSPFPLTNSYFSRFFFNHQPDHYWMIICHSLDDYWPPGKRLHSELERSTMLFMVKSPFSMRKSPCSMGKPTIATDHQRSSTGHGFPQALASLESDGVTLKRRGCMALFVVLLVRFVC